MSVFPWADWLRGALALGLPPEAFWRLSLAEWRALAGAAPALDRADLLRLMTRYPDEASDDETP